MKNTESILSKMSNEEDVGVFFNSDLVENKFEFVMLASQIAKDIQAAKYQVPQDVTQKYKSTVLAVHAINNGEVNLKHVKDKIVASLCSFKVQQEDQNSTENNMSDIEWHDVEERDVRVDGAFQSQEDQGFYYSEDEYYSSQDDEVETDDGSIDLS